jgi:hypothetical protein
LLLKSAQRLVDRVFECLMPWPRFDAECAKDCHAIQPGIGGADRGRRIVAGLDRHDLRRPAEPLGREVDDRAAKLEPTGLPGPGEMIDPVGPLRRLRRATQCDFEARCGDIARRGRAPRAGPPRWSSSRAPPRAAGSS